MTCLAFNAAMDIQEIRRKNLENLLEGFHTIREFADATGSAPAHISQMKNGVRVMGTAVARRIEHAMGKPRGWMDQSHLEDETPEDYISDEAKDLAKVFATQPAENLNKLRALLVAAGIEVELPDNVIPLPPRDALVITDPREKRLVEAFRSVNPIGQQMLDIAARGAIDNYSVNKANNKTTNNH